MLGRRGQGGIGVGSYDHLMIVYPIYLSIYLSSCTATPPREDYVQVIARRDKEKEE